MTASTELLKIPMPREIGGITEEKWNSFSAETQHSLLAHMQSAIATMQVSEAQLKAGEYPGGVAGNTRDGLTEVFPTTKLSQ